MNKTNQHADLLDLARMVTCAHTTKSPVVKALAVKQGRIAAIRWSYLRSDI